MAKFDEKKLSTFQPKEVDNMKGKEKTSSAKQLKESEKKKEMEEEQNSNGTLISRNGKS